MLLTAQRNEGRMQKPGPSMATSEAFIRDGVISVFMMSDITEVTQKQKMGTRASGMEREDECEEMWLGGNCARIVECK